MVNQNFKDNNQNHQPSDPEGPNPTVDTSNPANASFNQAAAEVAKENPFNPLVTRPIPTPNPESASNN